MFVEDVERSKAFYERVFAQPMIHEDGNAVAFKFENTVINLLKNPAARDLIKPATPGRSDGGSRFQLTIEVDDADAASRELTSRGVTLLNGPMDRPWGLRTASFMDPDGHIWEVASSLRPQKVP